MPSGYYNSANDEERRKFFGIVADAVDSQVFFLKNKEEVERFSELIASYVDEETHIPFHGIDLPRWYDKCMAMDENGRKLFAAILDLKITFAFVFIDFYKTITGFEAINSKESPNIMSDPILFKKKIVLLHDNIDMAIRFRTFFDKFMGVLILLFCPEKYGKFGRSGSRKEDFKKLMNGYIDSETLDSLFMTISELDDQFRTPEVHQTGKMRKWVLGGRDCFLDNAISLGGYYNSILYFSNMFDELLEVDKITD